MSSYTPRCWRIALGVQQALRQVKIYYICSRFFQKINS